MITSPPPPHLGAPRGRDLSESATRLWAQGKRWGGIRRKIQNPSQGSGLSSGKSRSSGGSGSGNASDKDPGEPPRSRASKKRSTEEPDEWSMEWLETLEPEQLVSLDKTKLLKVLMGELDKDKGWEKLPYRAKSVQGIVAGEGEDDDDDDDAFDGEGNVVTGDDDYDNMEEEDDDDDAQFEHLWTEEELEELGRAEMLLEDEYEDPAIVARDAEQETEEEEEEDELADEEEEEWAVEHDHLEGDEDHEGEDDDEWDSVQWEDLSRASDGPEYETDEDDLWDSGDEADESDEMATEAFGAAPMIMEDPQEMRAALRECVEYGDYVMAASLMEQVEGLKVNIGEVAGLEELLANGGGRPRMSQEEKSRRVGSLKSSEDVERSALGLLTDQELQGMQEAGSCVGIDLGTTNSAVSVVVGGQVIVVPSLPEGRNILPSAVRFTPDGDVIVGTEAKEQQVEDSDNTFVSIKRLIGRGMLELVEEHEVLDTINLVEKGKKLVAAYSPARAKEITPEDVSAEIIRTLVKSAEAYLERKVNRAVITVPAYFTQDQMSATERAGALAGLQRVRLLREPEAAALAYGLDKRDDQLILVFDLGGGTFDISILEVGGGMVEVVATFGDNHLGGNDFDKAIVDWILEKYLDSHGVGYRPDRQGMRRLLDAAERARVQLSSEKKVTIDLPPVDTWRGLSVTLSRREMESLFNELFQRILVPLRQAALMAGVSLDGEVNPETLQRGLTDEALLEGEDELDIDYENFEGADLEAQLAKLKQRAIQGRRLSKAKGKYTKELRQVRQANPDKRIHEFPAGRRISEVVLVGGATRMPCIRRLVEAVTGVKTQLTVDPDEAVALGAGIQAAIMDGVITDLDILTPMQAAVIRGLAELEQRASKKREKERMSH